MNLKNKKDVSNSNTKKQNERRNTPDARDLAVGDELQDLVALASPGLVRQLLGPARDLAVVPQPCP